MQRVENYVTLEFLSRSSNEGFARVAAAGFAAQLDPTLDELGDIKTAVSEAVTNAIVHGYPDQLGKIAVKLKLLPNNTLEITVRDWGAGIEDIQQARQPLFTTGGEERSGMLYHYGELYGQADDKICAGARHHRHHAQADLDPD